MLHFDKSAVHAAVQYLPEKLGAACLWYACIPRPAYHTFTSRTRRLIIISVQVCCLADMQINEESAVAAAAAGVISRALVDDALRDTLACLRPENEVSLLQNRKR